MRDEELAWAESFKEGDRGDRGTTAGRVGGWRERGSEDSGGFSAVGGGSERLACGPGHV